MTKTNKKRKNNKIAMKPQPGDPNYKTPTQLRNARKRRKLKNDKKEGKIKIMQKQQQQQQGSLMSDTSLLLSSSTTKKQQASLQVEDPSLRYISNPKSAPTVKRAMEFFEIKGQKFQVYDNSPPEGGWRTVSKLAVRKCPTDSCLKVGLFVPGSHTLLPTTSTQVHHHPNINSALNVVQKKCRQLHIEAYNEFTGKGNLRHIAINIQRSTGKQQITLIWKDDNIDDNVDDDDDDGRNEDNNDLEDNKKKTSSNNSNITNQQQPKLLLEKLCKELICVSENNSDKRLTLHSLWVHKNNTWKHANNIFDYNGKWILKYGQEYCVEQLDFTKATKSIVEEEEEEESKRKDDEGKEENNNNNNNSVASLSPPPKIKLQFPPQVFRQANIDAFTFIIAKIRYWLILFNSTNTTYKYKNCVELYGGVGTIGLHLVDIIRNSLLCSDENPYNRECFELSKKELLLPSSDDNDESMTKKIITKNISYESKSATQMVVESGCLKNADLIIVDPPRKGLDQQVLQSLCNNETTANATLIYVSCGFDAFCNDYEQLTTAGKWKLQHAEGHVLFPGSDAIETLAFFTN